MLLSIVLEMMDYGVGRNAYPRRAQYEIHGAETGRAQWLISRAPFSPLPPLFAIYHLRDDSE